MPIITLTMPDALTIDTDAPFDEKIWATFKREAVAAACDVLKSPFFDALQSHFDVAPITAKNHNLLASVDKLIEREFPKHGAPLHFLLSTLPLGGGYDPLLQDHLFHNCLQYWAFIDKNNQVCVGTCGIFLMSTNHAEALWAGWLVLDPSLRKQGTGKHLVDFVLAVSKVYGSAHGQTKLRFLTSNEKHVEAARHLYRAIGSQVIHSFPNPYVPGTEAMIMEWDIVNGHTTSQQKPSLQRAS